MKATTTIGRRVGWGFACLIALAGLSGAFAIYEVTIVRHEAVKMKDEYVPEARISAELEAHVGVLRLESQGYGLTSEKNRLLELHRELEIADRQVKELRALATAHPELTVLRDRVTEMEEHLQQFTTWAGRLATSIDAIQTGRAHLDEAAHRFTAELTKLGSDQFDRLEQEVDSGVDAEALHERARKLRLVQLIETELGELRMAAAKSQILRDPVLIETALPRFADVEGHLTSLRDLLHVATDLEELVRVTDSARVYRDNMQQMARLTVDLIECGTACDRLGADMLNASEQIAFDGMDRTSSAASETEQRMQLTVRGVITGVVLMALLGLIVSTRVVNRVKTALSEISKALASGSDQLVHASHLIADASTQVANGASEGAAALEETSASMEEIAGMVRRTARAPRRLGEDVDLEHGRKHPLPIFDNRRAETTAALDAAAKTAQE